MDRTTPTDDYPRISIITPSYNQGRYIGETIESVLAQNYPNIEHIIMDGGSTDGTLEITKRYPRLRVISERDKGQADAINRGFALATGEIFAFLNSDDTLLPGALQRVSKEIDSRRGRHIVMGRCRFIDENGQYFGIEHPSEFKNHTRVLKIWKGYALPQPSIFWTREAWQRCGGMDISLKYHLDYDLFCKMTQHYPIHCIDQVFATYRMHAESKTEQWTVGERLDDSIRLSRRYWGSSLSMKYWGLALSLLWYRFDRVGRARRMYLRFLEHRRLHKTIKGIPDFLVAAVLAPEVAFYMGAYPVLRMNASGMLHSFLTILAKRGTEVGVKTSVYFDRVDPWDDRWVGPKLVLKRAAAEGVQCIHVRGEVDLTFMSRSFSLRVLLDGQEVGEQIVRKTGRFGLEFPLREEVKTGSHTVEILASTWFVHHHFAKSDDYRPLAWRILQQDAVVLSSQKKQLLFVDNKARFPVKGAAVFTTGWYDAELSSLDWVRWTSGTGEMKLVVEGKSNASLRGEFYSLRVPNTLDIVVNGKRISSLEIGWEGFKPQRTMEFVLNAGENTVHFISHYKGQAIETDERRLAVALKNLLFEIEP